MKYQPEENFCIAPRLPRENGISPSLHHRHQFSDIVVNAPRIYSRGMPALCGIGTVFQSHVAEATV